MPVVTVVDPVMEEGALERLLASCESFPAYTPSGAGSVGAKRRRQAARRAAAATGEQLPAVTKKVRFAPGLGDRVDAAQHYLGHGGLRAATDDPLLPFRHRYFRETLLDGDVNYAPGIEELLHNERLADAARELSGRELVEPWNVYANVMLPGQELGVHTDIPEFVGATRKNQVPWLLCAMHLSGLFERWRVPIVTAVTYLQSPPGGGAFVWYPPGAAQSPRRLAARPNTAVVMDTDTIFHGVEAVPGESQAIRHIDGHARLVPNRQGRWSLRCGTPGELREVDSFSRDQLRLSLSWKAYCRSTDERGAGVGGIEPLTTDRIIERFVGELGARGRIEGPDHGLSEEELGLLIVDEFVPFPATESEGADIGRAGTEAAGSDTALR